MFAVNDEPAVGEHPIAVADRLRRTKLQGNEQILVFMPSVKDVTDAVELYKDQGGSNGYVRGPFLPQISLSLICFGRRCMLVSPRESKSMHLLMAESSFPRRLPRLRLLFPIFAT